LLQSVIGGAGATDTLVWTRVLAIIVGAICGLLAGWFVLPVRSEPIARLRVSQTLAALGEFVADRTDEADRNVTTALARLEEIAPPWDMWARLAPWQDGRRKPAEWMRLTHEAAHRIRRAEAIPGEARRALGEARRSMREPEKIGPAMLTLIDALDEPN
jgi:uncharacterized membrane protein YccC